MLYTLAFWLALDNVGCEQHEEVVLITGSAVVLVPFHPHHMVPVGLCL